MAPRKTPAGAAHVPSNHGVVPRCFGRGGIMFAVLLAFPTLLFVTLSRSPSLAADSDAVVAGPADHGRMLAHAGGAARSASGAAAS